MKKVFKILLSTFICFGIISCANSASDSNSNSNNEEITVRALIEKMPVSIEEFEAQAKSGNSSRAAIDFASNSGIKTYSYYNLQKADANTTYIETFLTVLKNDVITSRELDFDVITDISSVVPDSSATAEYLKAKYDNTATYDKFFTNLGKIKVSYKNNQVEIFWSLKTPSNDKDEPIKDIRLYIYGTYVNNIYSDLFSAVENGTADNGSIQFQSFKRNGTTYLSETSIYRTDKASSNTIVKKDGSKFISYGIGSIDLSSNPSEETLQAAKKCRRIRYKDSTGAYEFKNGKNSPKWNLYDIYDTDGSLIFEQDKREDENQNKFKQTIPLKYIRSSTAIEENSVAEIKNVSFEIGRDQDKDFPCYVMESASASEINLPEPFSFIKKDYAMEAISKLNAYLAESYTEEFSKELVSKTTIDSVKAKIAAWKESLSE